MSKPKLRVGGVPEHFNDPWLSLHDDVDFESYPGGTGAMIEALSLNKIDCALLLTEGAVKYCIEKQEAFIYGVYVQSPLVWGIHIGSQAPQNVTSMHHYQPNGGAATFAISRFGSGSHLMAFVLAKQAHLSTVRFSLVQNLAGATKELTREPETVFLWEKAMTDPLVQNGTFRRIGVLPTPWPCFVLCVRKQADLAAVEKVWNKLRMSCEAFTRGGENSIVNVVNKYKIQRPLVEEWFSALRYFGPEKELEAVLELVRNTLVEVGQLSPELASFPVSRITMSGYLSTSQL